MGSFSMSTDKTAITFGCSARRRATERFAGAECFLFCRRLMMVVEMSCCSALFRKEETMQHLDFSEIKCSLFIDDKVHFMCVQPGYEKNLIKNVDVNENGNVLFLILHNVETQASIARFYFELSCKLVKFESTLWVFGKLQILCSSDSDL